MLGFTVSLSAFTFTAVNFCFVEPFCPLDGGNEIHHEEDVPNESIPQSNIS